MILLFQKKKFFKNAMMNLLKKSEQNEKITISPISGTIAIEKQCLTIAKIDSYSPTARIPR
jgi:hypothetical protein